MNICFEFDCGYWYYAYARLDTVFSMESWDELKLKVELEPLKLLKSLDAFGDIRLVAKYDDYVQIAELCVKLIAALINGASKQIDIAGYLGADVGSPVLT